MEGYVLQQGCASMLTCVKSPQWHDAKYTLAHTRREEEASG